MFAPSLKFQNDAYLINVQILTAKVKFTGYSVIDSIKDAFMVYQRIFISSSQLGNCFQFTDFPVISKFPKIQKSGVLQGMLLTSYDNLVPFQSW